METEHCRFLLSCIHFKQHTTTHPFLKKKQTTQLIPFTKLADLEVFTFYRPSSFFQFQQEEKKNGLIYMLDLYSHAPGKHKKNLIQSFIYLRPSKHLLVFSVSD